MEQIDVAVIGGGRSGLAAAHALRGRGLQSVALEASGRAAGSPP
ncbi:FAD-binding protein [Streptomyces phaeochromogenes]|nr:FAD-binding protein [Streptomyces phaeochromogenes]